MKTEFEEHMEVASANVGAGRGRWPAGVVDFDVRQRMVEWARFTGRTLSMPRRQCLHWLLGRGQGEICAQRIDRSHDGVVTVGPLYQALENVSFWECGGGPSLILAQPRVLDLGVVTSLEKAWPVSVTVTEVSPWFGRGTFGVYITPLP